MDLLNKVWAFIVKNIGIVVAVVVVLFIGLYFKDVYWSGRLAEAKAIFEMDKIRLQTEIAAKIKEVKKWELEANKNREEANKQGEKNRILLGQKDEADRKRKEAEAKVAALSPGEIVVETRLELSAKETEVWLTAQGIIFDITSAKKNLVKLRGWAHYTNNIIPKYKVLVIGLGEEITKLREEGVNLRVSLANCKDAVEAGMNLTKKYDDLLKKTAKLKNLFKWTVGGTTVVVVVYVVLRLIGVVK